MSNNSEKKHNKWLMITLIICFVLTILLFIFALPLSYLAGHGISKSSMDVVQKFLSSIMNDSDYLFTMYGKWWHQLWNHHGGFSLSLWIPVLPFITIPLGLIIGYIFCSDNSRHNRQS